MKKLWGDVNRLHVGLRCPNKVRRLPGDVSNLKRLKAPQFRCLAYIFDQNPNYTGSPLRLIRQLPRSLRYVFTALFLALHLAIVWGAFM